MAQRRNPTGKGAGNRGEGRTDSHVHRHADAQRTSAHAPLASRPPRRHFVFLVVSAVAVTAWMFFLAAMAYFG